MREGRGIIYSSYAIKHPDELQVVAVAEPDDFPQKLY